MQLKKIGADHLFDLTSKSATGLRAADIVRLCWCLSAGMQAFYEVKSCNSDSTAIQGGRVVRNYYIAVEKVLWDYAPSGKDLINDTPLTKAGRWAKISRATHSSILINKCCKSINIT